MGFRLKTSKKTKDIFDEIGASTNLKPFILCKIAIALSLKKDESIEDYVSDTNGMELQRTTVTGDQDALYKCLMESKLGVHLSDDDYFPTYTKKHIDRGTELLHSTYKYSGGNLEKFLKLLINKGDVSI
ncbi:DNA sulfur modification protein DndE [Clostridium sp. N3C]|uniref:DndE family protein n=1 Tax=Clostridium sp. N3C TaxID=1776758 RepID=UPI00092E08FA|nr:DndE family protein [Clostridium sp. N3C]SCN25607.1 DNA sulfur modification protein DndE [Clostridium sp. N3C]